MGKPKNGASRLMSHERSGSLNQSSSLFFTVSSTKPCSYSFRRKSREGSRFKNKCRDFFITGVAPDTTDTGLIKSEGSNVLLHTSQESPYWSGDLQLGQV